MSFYGYHGVYKEENTLGQRFNVDLKMKVDLKEASQEDNVDKSVDYGDAYQVVKDVVEGRTYNLVETIAERIAQRILEEYSIVMEVTVKVIKPDPPIPGHYDSVAIEITRSRA